MNIIEVIDDPFLFGGMFDASSWEPWRSFLEALFALPMSDDHRELYRHHTGRTALPVKPSRYAELVVGRRGGKSRILALIATYLGAFTDPDPYLAPGEVPVIAIIAKDRDQAGVILSYIAGFLKAVNLLAEMIEDEKTESVSLTNGVIIEVHTGSIGAPRGRTFLAVLADETAFWPNGDSANPDVEIINAVRPGLSTIPYSILLIASSPYAKRGLLYTNYSRYHGVDGAPVLVWQGSTEEMNSDLIGDPLIAEMYDEDPERASAEFGAQFRTDIVAFITREAVEACLARDVREIPPGGGITYVGHVDPSGGSADSMTLAIAHLSIDGTAILDAVREVKPPFSPDAVVEEFATLLKSYGIMRTVGDAYAGEWPRERFAVHGIAYDVSKRNTSTIYAEFLPALNGRRVQLLDLPRLIGQLVTLERRTARGGRDTIAHPPGQHDDLANAACGALVQVLADRRPALVRQSDMLIADTAAFDLPTHSKYIFGVLVTDKNGVTAVMYAATAYGSPELLLLDYDVEPLRGGLFMEIADRLRHFTKQCRSPGAAAFVCDDLLRHAIAGGLAANEIPQNLRPEQLLLTAAAHISRGAVKICVPAMEKARTSPLGGALDFRASDNAEDPLRSAALLTIALALEPVGTTPVPETRH